MSDKPKWSVEKHGPCPYPDLFDVVEQEVSDPLPPVSTGGPILVGQTYSVFNNNGYTPDDAQAFVPWDTVGSLPYDSNTKAVTLPNDGIYVVTYEVDFDAPPEAWHWYAVVSPSVNPAPAFCGDLLSGGGGWERSAIFGSCVVRIAGTRTLGLRLNLVPDPAAISPSFPACSFAEMDMTRIA